MPAWATVLIVTLGLLALAEACWILMRERRSAHLRNRFGSEYDRVIEVVLETRDKASRTKNCTDVCRANDYGGSAGAESEIRGGTSRWEER